MQDALQNVRDNKEEISYLFLFYFPLILKSILENVMFQLSVKW